MSSRVQEQVIPSRGGAADPGKKVLLRTKCPQNHDDAGVHIQQLETLVLHSGWFKAVQLGFRVYKGAEARIREGNSLRSGRLGVPDGHPAHTCRGGATVARRQRCHASDRRIIGILIRGCETTEVRAATNGVSRRSGDKSN